jgi:uncharacterized FAD-dependent dehydrogenase
VLFRLTNFRTPVETDDRELTTLVSHQVGVPADDLSVQRILRKSLDARQRNRLQFVYSLLIESPASLPCSSRLEGGARLESWTPSTYADPDQGTQPLTHRPVIVGSGPAGLLAGYYLSLRGYQPLIIERGQPVRERVSAVRSFEAGGPHDEENNYLFGEGGAGCFSDGKLTCRITGPDVDWVLRAFVECGGRPSLVYEHRPHLGSNKLPLICRNFRRRIEAAGGEYRFGCRLEGFQITDGQLTGLQTSSGFIATTLCTLAIGHSARDTYQMLYEAGLPIQQKAFQLGLRIEHPQAIVNQHKYGRSEYLQLLGAADYSLVAKGKHDLFTFCMCAGGIVIPSISEKNMFCSNGMSNSRHDTPYANSGLVVTLKPADFGSQHPLAGMHLQRQYESRAFQIGRAEYLAPAQPAHDFIADRAPAAGGLLRSSYQRGVVPANLSEVLPPIIADAIRVGLPDMDRQWGGDYLRDAVLVGPEMRGSSPVRIDRSRETMTVPHVNGLYPVGEGAGYAGGIVTAAVDGLRAAKAIVAQYAPLNSAAATVPV